MNVTIFKDFQDISKPHYITIDQALERVKVGKSKDKVLEIRNKVAKGEKCDDLKKELPCVLFSASKVRQIINRRDNESYRDDSSVSEHSGLFALDFDKCDVALKIEQLKKDPYIYCCYLSASGTGVRALVRCPSFVDKHSLYYTAFLDRYPDLDPTSRNISRVSFESYDPDLWVNPNALVWDKRLTEDQRRRNRELIANRKGNQVISTAVAMVRSSYDGTKHESLRNAAVLLGGYIATGRVNEDEAVKILEEEIRLKNPDSFQTAQKTIQDGIHYGKSRPLVESKKIEKAQQFLRRADGSYDFLADDREMLEYELAVINGTLEMGLPTGLNSLNKHWMFKKHTLVWIGALDNVGKSFGAWYLSVLAAKYHGWKFAINSNENSDGELRKKLKEFFLGKSIKVMDDEELTIADDFIKKHYRIMSSKHMHSIEDWLLKGEVLYDEGFEFEVLIGDPFNSFDVPDSIDLYRHDIKALNMMRVFKENYSSIWMTDHVNSAAARNKDSNGYINVPWKSDISQGQIKANKVDDFIMFHRLINHPEKKNEMQIHVNKIKSVETGGFPTTKDEPVIITLNPDYCGFSDRGIDPIKYSRI